MKKQEPVHHHRIKIRKLFYLAFTCVLLAQTVYSYIIYKMDLEKEYRQREEHVVSQLLVERKLQTKHIVESQIANMNHLETLLKKQCASTADELLNRLSEALREGRREPFLSDLTAWFPYNQLDFQIMDAQTGTVLAGIPCPDSAATGKEPVILKRQTVMKGRYEIQVYLLSDDYYRILLNEIRALFYESSLMKEYRISISQLFDSAPRNIVTLINPEYPGTEGTMKPIVQEAPEDSFLNLKELAQLKSQGHTYRDFYSKATETEPPVRRLSYTMLYDRYNWVVRTETNLENLDSYILREREALEALYSRKELNFIKLIFLSLILSIGLFYLLELRISRIIADYDNKLIEEKDRLSRAYLKMKDMAFIDSLTGLYNRRAMNLKLEEEISYARRNGRDFCIILGDVDKFKAINDSYGHDAGDFILRELSRIMRVNLRLEDRIARWGGEEFLIFISDADKDKGKVIAEKLRAAIEAQKFKYSGKSISVTMTFGICPSEYGSCLNDLINMADENLYRGKRSTRNCVII